jgi:hypothetical protein
MDEKHPKKILTHETVSKIGEECSSNKSANDVDRRDITVIDRPIHQKRPHFRNEASNNIGDDELHAKSFEYSPPLNSLEESLEDNGDARFQYEARSELCGPLASLRNDNQINLNFKNPIHEGFLLSSLYPRLTEDNFITKGSTDLSLDNQRGIFNRFHHDQFLQTIVPSMWWKTQVCTIL